MVFYEEQIKQIHYSLSTVKLKIQSFTSSIINCQETYDFKIKKIQTVIY